MFITILKKEVIPVLHSTALHSNRLTVTVCNSFHYTKTHDLIIHYQPKDKLLTLCNSK